MTRGENMSDDVAIDNFRELFDQCHKALEVVGQSVDIFFPIEFRELFTQSVASHIENFRGEPAEIVIEIDNFILNEYPNKYARDLNRAGLSGVQKAYKFKEFELAVNNFNTFGGINYLLGLLTKGVIIVKSLVGAIPAIGSSLQELIDFVIERLKSIGS